MTPPVLCVVCRQLPVAFRREAAHRLPSTQVTSRAKRPVPGSAEWSFSRKRATEYVAGALKVLVDENGLEWECIDVSPPRGSYSTYMCRRRGNPEEAARQISVPRRRDR
jgi:hypothetical protein